MNAVSDNVLRKLALSDNRSLDLDVSQEEVALEFTVDEVEYLSIALHVIRNVQVYALPLFRDLEVCRQRLLEGGNVQVRLTFKQELEFPGRWHGGNPEMSGLCKVYGFEAFSSPAVAAGGS